MSASKLGYFVDDFVSYFVSPLNARRMPPLINKGYYTRVAAVRNLIDQFLHNGGQQIVSFGAGYDTNYWRLKKRSNPAFHKYYEVDFPHVVAHKAKIISKNNNLLQALVNPKFNGNGNISSSDYALVGLDMRETEKLETLLKSENIQPDLPTLFLSECVLIYMNPKDSASLIQWTSQYFTSSMFVIYEQIHPFDSFGQVMLSNLEARGVPLASIKTYPDINAQKKRMMDLGYPTVEGLNMNEIFTHLLDQKENQRVSRLEIFDEFEEWYLIQAHYCIILAIQEKQDKKLASVTLEQSAPKK
uniref:Leucine carboxyl methyltransferase 1 n=1 Tax=Arcella intermedia TaxID=1963864 RepID=A0A6B2LBH7_9EUKA